MGNIRQHQIPLPVKFPLCRFPHILDLRKFPGNNAGIHKCAQHKRKQQQKHGHEQIQEKQDPTSTVQMRHPSIPAHRRSHMSRQPVHRFSHPL
ncbi:MAG: hypothetical protein SPE01_04150, partial [Candidatus Spyradocola sp.]|nr:hypothetical protein [Candidatus Spyradocola sp.]